MELPLVSEVRWVPGASEYPKNSTLNLTLRLFTRSDPFNMHALDVTYAENKNGNFHPKVNEEK